MKFILSIILFFSAFLLQTYANDLSLQQKTALVQSSDWVLQQAFANKKSNLQVKGVGKVFKLLSDDLKGDRHQRFILRLNNGMTVLIAHNIDIAPRVNGLKVGDTISFYGEYEWNSQGGVIHWTHRDPQKKHINGWLNYKGKVYQ